MDILAQAYKRVKTLDRSNLIAPKVTSTKTEDTLVLTMTYYPNFTPLKDIVHKSWDLLKRSSSTKTLSETKVINAYKRPKNLRDILVKAKLPKLEEADKLNRQPNSLTLNACNRKECRYCDILDRSGRITSKFSGREYTCKKNVTCKSSNLIYCIECTRCGLQYVGQTMNKLMMRFQAHWQTIDNKLIKYDVAKHFTEGEHEGTKDMKIYVLDFIYAHPKSEMAKSLRDTIEFHWIYRLRTCLPMGLNTMDKPPPGSKWKRYWKSFKK